jgi:non-heme chloroperoxidase
MPYIPLNDNDAKLYYEEHAPKNRELIVLVHGSLGDYRDWANQTAYFSKLGYRVVTYSRRNHFPNPYVEYPSNYSLLTERDDLFALLCKLEGSPAILIGHSYGGYAVALVARDYSKYVKKIVLAEPPIFTIIENEEDFKLRLSFLSKTIEPARNYLKNDQPESAIRVFLDGITGIEGVYDRLRPQFRQVMLDNARTALPEIEITPERDPFNCKDATKISSPTLLVTGDKSPRILHSVTIELSKCIPKSRVVTISNSSHGVIWDNPTEFNEAVARFLSEGADK